MSSERYSGSINFGEIFLIIKENKKRYYNWSYIPALDKNKRTVIADHELYPVIYVREMFMADIFCEEKRSKLLIVYFQLFSRGKTSNSFDIHDIFDSGNIFRYCRRPFERYSRTTS